MSKLLRHYDIFLCIFCNVCPIYKLSSQIYSLDYEDYFQLLATAQKRFHHFENKDKKNYGFEKTVSMCLKPWNEKKYYGHDKASQCLTNAIGYFHGPGQLSAEQCTWIYNCFKSLNYRIRKNFRVDKFSRATYGRKLYTFAGIHFRSSFEIKILVPICFHALQKRHLVSLTQHCSFIQHRIIPILFPKKTVD